jgi:dienelactone hydrolase
LVDQFYGNMYQGMVMFSSIFNVRHSLAALVFIAHIAVAQSPAPFTRTTPAPKLDPSSPANIGRTNLTHHLDTIATGYIATRTTEVAAIHTRAEAEARQIKVRKQILSLIGQLPERTPLNAKTLGITQADGFRIEKVLFESQPGFRVTALLYIPDKKSNGQKLPAILIAPGHGPSGKTGDYATAASFARNGFIVLSYDPIGQGERLQYPDTAKPEVSLATRPTGEHGEAGLQPSLIGDAVARYFLWDAMRAIDYLSQRPEVDSKRIGAFGCSGGGAMTALVGALDPRIAAVGVACYTTSFDTLLPSIGPQDGEQSIPHFIASGLDFPDWVELAAPRPYAVIATYSDMFPFAGARSTVIEARRFYSLFDPQNAGTQTASAAPSVPPVLTSPALNSDTTNNVSPHAALQFITGPGGHGALAPIMGDILSFFIRNLEPGADADHPVLPPPRKGSPFAPPTDIPASAFQVTPTGQIASSYPRSETVFTLNQRRAAEVIPAHRPVLSGEKLVTAIRETTGSSAKSGDLKPDAETLAAKTGHFLLRSKDGIDLQGDISIPSTAGRHPAVLLLVPDSIQADNPIAHANKARFDRLAAAGNLVLAITPRPSPPGTDDMKSPILGPFYLLNLRAELVSRTIIGIRVDDVIRATDYLSSRPDVDSAMITGAASGHMGLVLLHAAVLDRRLKHITIDHVLASYRSLLDAPLPTGASEDVIPGVVLRYDIPDLTKSLGSRLTETDPLQGTDDLSESSTPLKVLSNPIP